MKTSGGLVSRRLCVLALFMAMAAGPVACNCGPSSAGDAGFDGGQGDAGAADAGQQDAGQPDAGMMDAGQIDAGQVDAGQVDAGQVDAGQVDAGMMDAGGECVDAGVITSSLAVTDTRHTFDGTTTATTTGTFVVRGLQGQELRGSLPTDSEGLYSVELPLFCGAQTVELAWPGPLCTPTVLITVDRQECTQPDIQVALTWDALGDDFELHLIKPAGHLNDDATDCTWTSCITSSPDWGVQEDPTDNPHKDVDNTGNFGPENIYLNKPEAGIYWVMVEHWGAGAPTADGQVTITLAGSAPVVLPITDLASHFTRSVAQIDWSTRTVIPSTIVTDCTATWSGGCRVVLP